MDAIRNDATTRLTTTTTTEPTELRGTRAISGDTTLAAVLPAPAAGTDLLDAGDVGAAMARLVLESAHAREVSARMTRELAESAQRAAEEKQLVELREQGASRLAAGLAGGLATIASGTLSLVGAAKTADVKAAAGPQALRNADAAGKTWEGTATVVNGTGKVTSAIFESGASAHETEATRASHATGHARQQVDDARASADEAAKRIDKTVELYREYQAARAAAQQAALLRA